MNLSTQQVAAGKLRALHAAGVLVLPNAWDAASAAVIARAGAQAIATTSGGVSWSLGRSDGQRLTRAEMTGRVREIAAAVAIPVTADIEGGYGPDPGDVALTVEAVIAAGVRRVSVGTAIAQAAYSLAQRAAAELLTTGGYATLEQALDFSAVNGLFAPGDFG